MQKLTQDQLDQLTIEANEYLAETGRKRFPAAKADELRELGTKRCPKCATVQLIADFQKDPSARDGLRVKCRACCSAEGANFRKRNPEYGRNYHAANREKRSEYNREHYAANREHYREYERNRYHNDEHHRLNQQLRDGYYRTARAGNTAEWITADQLLTYWQAKNIPALECYLTGEPLTPQTRSIDHVVAISNGGEHVVDNIMPATLEANRCKQNLSPDEAKQRLTND